MNVDDSTLWHAFRKGEREAYATIYHQHIQFLFQYGCRLSSDRERVKDAIQDVFYYLWEHRSNLSNIQNIKYYLATALRRKIIEQTKLSTFTKLHEHSAVIPSFESERVDEEIQQDNLRYLRRGLNQLSERQREAIFMRYYQNMPVSEIAQAMNVQRRVVYKHLKNAVKTLMETWPAEVQKATKTISWCSLVFQVFNNWC